MSTFTATNQHNAALAYGRLPGLDAITRLLADAQQAIGRDQHVLKDCLVRASALLHRSANCPEAGTLVHKGGLTTWQAKRVCAYVEANLGGRIRACDLARAVDLSTSHFFRVFRETFGVPPLTFVARRRMQRAQEIMRESREPLAQVALACGLCDQAHFTRMFRRVVGSTPRDWRREFCDVRSN